jgi:hypothetical protein
MVLISSVTNALGRLCKWGRFFPMDAAWLIPGGSQPDATATTEIIDLSKANPTFASAGNMPPGPRVEGNAVLLPTGKLLAQGGSTIDEDASTATVGADLYAAHRGSWDFNGDGYADLVWENTSTVSVPSGLSKTAFSPVRLTYPQCL